MALSNSLVYQFAKITNDTQQEKTDTTVQGKVVIVGTEKYVKLDGSELLTPVKTQVSVKNDERVNVEVKNHKAIIVGSVGNPAASMSDSDATNAKVTELYSLVADKVTVNQLDAQIARIDSLAANDVTINGRLDADEANITTLQADNVTIKGNLSTNTADITTLKATTITTDVANATYATITNLNATNVELHNLSSTYATFESTTTNKLTANQASIDTLTTDMASANTLISQKASITDLNAATADITVLKSGKADVGSLNAAVADINTLKTGKADIDFANVTYANISTAFINSLNSNFANIDFANIGEAALTKIYATNGIIRNLVMQAGKVTGELIGVTINGDLINANTLKADRIIVKGASGLYYQLNVNALGQATADSDTKYQNGIDGTNIIAKSLTADKVTVTDLSAFGATIGGYHITETSLYSGTKASVDNTTQGIYMDNTSQVNVGNASSFIKYYLDTDGTYKLSIKASDISLSSGGPIGEKGDTGVGITSMVSKYQGSADGTTAPTGTWLDNPPLLTDATPYLWTKITITYTDTTTSSYYQVTKKGDPGPQGPKGNQGIPGATGKDGKGITGTVITYGISANETTQPATWSASVPTLVKGQYLWTKTVWTYTDSTNETGYTKTYIAKDGNNGTDGIAGKDGVGISSTAITYTASSSGTTVPSSGWTASVPNVSQGQYLWTKTIWSYTDNTSETGYSVARMGADGAQGPIGPKGDTGASGKDGVAGKDGLGIKSTTIAYQLSSSGTTVPTGTWSATVPTLTKGQYLWTRTTLTYTDNTMEPVYSVSYVAKDGNDGSSGVAGKDGVGINSTTITYQGSTSGTVQPTGTWVANPPSVSGGNYLWTRTVWGYTDGTSETGYSVAKAGEKGDKGDKGDQGLQGLQGPKGDQGIAGPKGTDGKTQYTHIAYANSANGVTDFTVSDSNRTYIGMYVDFTATDSTAPSDYSWTLIKGANGANGIPGKAGADGETPYFHIAYADSADGKDGFYVGGGTNLLTGTGNHTVTGTTTGKWITGQLSNETTDDFLTLFKGLEGQTVTVSVDYEYSGFIAGSSDSRTGWEISIISDTTSYRGAWYYPENDSGSGRISITFVVPQNITAVNECMGYINFTGSGTGTVSHLKLEKGSVATPWSPAPSEAHPIYMGTYTDYTQADSLDPTAYKWTQIKGASIKASSMEYYLSSSSVEQKDGSWTSVFPEKTPTTYIWYRNLITYTDNTTALSDPVLYSFANNFYTTTQINTSNISQLNESITHEVQNITTVTDQLDKRQTATEDSITTLNTDTSASLDKLSKGQSDIAEDLAGYKNTVTNTYALKSEITQTAEDITAKITQAVKDAETNTITTLTTTVVDAQGFTVTTANADTHTTIDGAGIMVKDAQNNDVANFKASGSEIQKLKVINEVSMGAHSTQAYTDYELNENTMENGDSIVGSADFWIGDVN